MVQQMVEVGESYSSMLIALYGHWTSTLRTMMWSTISSSERKRSFAFWIRTAHSSKANETDFVPEDLLRVLLEDVDPQVCYYIGTADTFSDLQK